MMRWIAALALLASSVHAWEAVDHATVLIDMTWTEPTLMESGNPLVDLAYTRAYIDGVMALEVPGSSPSGGGPVVVQVIVPAPVGQVTVAVATARAVRLSGQESLDAPLDGITITIDRARPSAPDAVAAQ